MKLTEYNEKLCFLNLSVKSDFLDIRAAGNVMPDESYRQGDVPHGYTLIEYMYAGRAVVRTKKAVHEIRQGDLLILTPSEDFKYECDPAAPVGKLWMTLRGRYPDSLISLYSVRDSRSIVNAPGCQPIMERIVSLLSDFGIRELELCHMLLDLFDCAYAPPRVLPELPLAEQIRNVLDRHLEKPVKISDIAGYFCKSARQIERIFEEQFGVTAYCYLRDQRFAAACRELRSTNELVYVIAERFQLGSPGYFAREFTKRFGMTPMEYRNRFRQGSTLASGDAGNETIYDYVPHMSF